MSQGSCDHKFIDSTHCLKCGWLPPTIETVECDECRGSGQTRPGETCFCCSGCGRRCTECGNGSDYCECDEGGES